MEPAVIAALIAALASVVGAVIAAVAAIKNRSGTEEKEFRTAVAGDLEEIKQQQVLAIYRIGELEKKQDKSNSVKERVSGLETQIVEVNARAKSNQHRLDRLEGNQ